MKTKYGNVSMDDRGYYYITSGKEGNHGKLLHRLIFEDYHNCTLDSNDVIHHVDFDKTNNHPSNLICVSQKVHNMLHHNGEKYSNEHRQNISNSLSNSKNTSGYYRVSKKLDEKYVQGFTWRYRYMENSKQKVIYSTDLKKLESKVKAKGLEWREIH